MVSSPGRRSVRLPAFRVFSQTGAKKLIHRVVSPDKSQHGAGMGRGRTSRGMEECCKLTFLVGSFDTMLVISTALSAQYCALNHERNGYLCFVNRLPLIQ
jgi:hypothetical protein